jgi:hypothetical protein
MQFNKWSRRLFSLVFAMSLFLRPGQGWSFNSRMDELERRTLKRFHATPRVSLDVCNPHKPQKQILPQNK